MKTIVASMLFRTRDVLAYDAPSSSLHNFDSNEELLKTANEMVNMQKMAFVQSKEFNPESLSTDSALKPNKSLVCKRPHDRLVSTREHVLKKEKTQKTCRFCHSVLPKPHGKNTCPLRLQYRHGMTQERYRSKMIKVILEDAWKQKCQLDSQSRTK